MPAAVTRIFRLFRLFRGKRNAQNSVDGAPTNLRPGELAFGDAEELLYVAKSDGALVTFDPNVAGPAGATGPTGPTGLQGVTGATGPAGSPLPTVTPLAYAATVTTDASAGDIFDLTLTGNVTLANPTNTVNGKTLTWRILQDGTGGRTVTLGDKFSVPSITSGVLSFSSPANAFDTLSAMYHAARDKWFIADSCDLFPRGQWSE